MDFMSGFNWFCYAWMVSLLVSCILSLVVAVICRLSVWNKSRIQYIEIHDQHWSPVIFQQFVRRILYSGMYRGIGVSMVKQAAAKIESIAKQHDVSVILDLCSGTCGPSEDINQYINVNKTVNDSKMLSILTDLFPQTNSWKVLVSNNPNLAFSAKPIDATDIDMKHINDIIAQHKSVSVGSKKPKIRTLAGAFHHFTPELCECIFRDAMANGDIMIVMDGCPEKTFANTFFWCIMHIHMLVYGLPALFKFWLFEERGTSFFQAIYKVLVTVVLFPVFLVAFFHDGFVSFARFYSAKELKSMAQNALAKLNDESIEYLLDSKMVGAKGMPMFVCEPTNY